MYFKIYFIADFEIEFQDILISFSLFLFFVFYFFNYSCLTVLKHVTNSLFMVGVCVIYFSLWTSDWKRNGLIIIWKKEHVEVTIVKAEKMIK